MKKQLLFGIAAFTALAVNAQNSRVITNPKAVKMNVLHPATEDIINAKAGSAITPAATSATKKVSASPYKRIGGSVNVLGVQVADTKVLKYNPYVNTVGFTSRIATTWFPLVPNGNSGTMSFYYSPNNGTAWDSTIVAANTTYLHRYPTGALFNPNGNTAPANAFAVVTGPNHTGATVWTGNFFASKQLTFPGSNTNGNVTYAINSALTPTQRVQHFTRINSQATNDNKVHVAGNLDLDPQGTTVATRGFRGAMINTGTYNAGTFTWTVDSLKPNFKVDGAGDINADLDTYHMAWSEDGQTGYVVFYGVDANAVAGTPANTFNPLVYKTTNGGVSWARHAPLFDFSSIPSLGDRTYPTRGVAGTLLKPFISASEGTDATVDANGNLHLFTSVRSSYSDNIDSLGYTYSPNFNQVWNYLVDLNTNATGWCAHVIDSLHNEGPTSNASDPSGTGTSNWTSSGTPFAYDARLQISKSVDGQYIFYTWAESDSNIVTPAHVSMLPDLMMKGYDLANNKFTATKNVTTNTSIEYNAFFFYTAPIVMRPTGTSFIIPASVTQSDDNSLNGDVAVSHYYIDDAGFTTSEFNITPIGSCAPMVTGIKQQNTTFESLNLYPNPASANATIDVVLNEKASLEIVVMNSVGQTVYTTTLAGNAGSNKVDVNLNNLSAGLYFYQVKVGDSKAITRKFTVSK